MVGLTVKGMSLSGTLICNSEMGITVMDLFNDILTNISDIQNFLTQYDVTPLTNKPGMIIQGFHMFNNCESCRNNFKQIFIFHLKLLSLFDFLSKYSRERLESVGQLPTSTTSYRCTYYR